MALNLGVGTEKRLFVFPGTRGDSWPTDSRLGQLRVALAAGFKQTARARLGRKKDGEVPGGTENNVRASFQPGRRCGRGRLLGDLGTTEPAAGLYLPGKERGLSFRDFCLLMSSVWLLQ